MNPRPPQLTDADEMLVHQHVGTFAEVATTDPAWTERVWAAPVTRMVGCMWPSEWADT